MDRQRDESLRENKMIEYEKGRSVSVIGAPFVCLLGALIEYRLVVLWSSLVLFGSSGPVRLFSPYLSGFFCNPRTTLRLMNEQL